MMNLCTSVLIKISPFLIIISAYQFSTSAQVPGCHPDFSYSITGNSVEFNDASTFDVGPQNTSWTWDFGDGNTTTDQNAIHIYTLNQGEYVVCLTVTNCGIIPGSCCSETFCDTIRMDEVATAIENQNQEDQKFLVFPNPASGSFEISYTLYHLSDVSIEIFDVNGKLIHNIGMNDRAAGNQKLKFPGEIFTSPGVYFIRFTIPGKQISSVVVSKL